EIPSPDDEAAVLDLLDNIDLDKRIQLSQKRDDLHEEFKNDPILQFRNTRIEPGKTWFGYWSGWSGFEFWPVVTYLKEHEPTRGPVTDKVTAIAATSESANVRHFAQFLKKVVAEELPSLTENPSFEQGNEDAPPWTFWNADGSASIQRGEGTAATGSRR